MGGNIPREAGHSTGERRERWLTRESARGWWSSEEHARRWHPIHRHRRWCCGRGVRLGPSTIYTAGTPICSGGRARAGVVRAHECSVRCELCAQFIFCERAVLDFGSFGLGLGNGACGETELDLFAPFVVCHVRGRDTFHSENFDFVPVAARKGVIDAR